MPCPPRALLSCPGLLWLQVLADLWPSDALGSIQDPLTGAPIGPGPFDKYIDMLRVQYDGPQRQAIVIATSHLARPEQRAAAGVASMPLTLIQGPPGTGRHHRAPEGPDSCRAALFKGWRGGHIPLASSARPCVVRWAAMVESAGHLLLGCCAPCWASTLVY